MFWLRCLLQQRRNFNIVVIVQRPPSMALFIFISDERLHLGSVATSFEHYQALKQSPFVDSIWAFCMQAPAPTDQPGRLLYSDVISPACSRRRLSGLSSFSHHNNSQSSPCNTASYFAISTLWHCCFLVDFPWVGNNALKLCINWQMKLSAIVWSLLLTGLLRRMGISRSESMPNRLWRYSRYMHNLTTAGSTAWNAQLNAFSLKAQG